MKRRCRCIATSKWSTRQLAVTDLLRNATIVTDPIRLASLDARVAKLKAKSDNELLHSRRPSAL